MSSASDKFQGLLRELFQFDCADLDFGIYRVMNYKRGVIETFITETLPSTVADQWRHGPLADQALAAERLQRAVKEIHEGLGTNALDADGNLVRFQETPLGRKYLRAQRTAGLSPEAIEAAIYNHLYAFFSRYYQDGDFISKRRYSKRRRYAIPYDGEEVYLHWANSDQYYVKSDEHFRNYTFTRNGITVRFTAQHADVERNDVKGDKRFFLPRFKAITWDADAARVLIPFEYRRLTDREEIVYGRTGQQEAIIGATLTEVPRRLSGAGAAAAMLAAERHRNGNGNGDGRPVSVLEYHLRRYTRRNTSDFFVHKDLQGFLTQELDFYLKNEVLDLDEMAAAGEELADGWFQIMRVIKAVGGRIIDFLDQIESFQKMLWEKRKFITETGYCITVGNIDRRLYADIAACDPQWAEWKKLFHVDEDADDLFSNGDRNDRRIAFLKAHPTLVLDTRHFHSDFVDELFNEMDHVDARTDGLLIHGDNFQALGLLRESYRNRIECAYLDPPYNTGDSEILYKNEYLFSSWLTLMDNRLSLAMGLLRDDPVLFIAIDDFEMADLCELIDRRYPALRREMIVVNHHPQGGKARLLANTHEYMICCVSRDSVRTLVGRSAKDGDELRPFKRSGTAESNFRYARPNSFYAILVDGRSRNVVGAEPPPARGTDYPREDTGAGYVRVYPLGTQGEERVWRRSYESCLPLIRSGKLQCSNGFTIYHRIDVQDRTAAFFSNWVDPRYNAGTFGANLLGDVIGRHNTFSYPKSINTVSDAIFGADVGDDAYCIDFFAGSGTTGHAVIELNRADGGNRKFVMVEMGKHFDTVLLPRIKKVTFAPGWKDGKPQRAATPEEAERSPRIVKYHRIESYEDALNNIVFDEAEGQQALRFDDYLIRYLLKWETRKSETLLNVEKLSRPFDYRLRVHDNGQAGEQAADLPETFNYLLGLRVRTRRVHHDQGRRYLVYRGTVEERTAVVIWRDTEGWGKDDVIRDKEFVAEQGLADGADSVYVNGDSFIPNAKALEPVFKARMFAPLET